MFMTCQLEHISVSSTLTCIQEKANMVMLLVLAYKYGMYTVHETVYDNSTYVLAVICMLYIYVYD